MPRLRSCLNSRSGNSLTHFRKMVQSAKELDFPHGKGHGGMCDFKIPLIMLTSCISMPSSRVLSCCPLKPTAPMRSVTISSRKPPGSLIHLQCHNMGRGPELQIFSGNISGIATLAQVDILGSGASPCPEITAQGQPLTLPRSLEKKSF